MSKEKLTASLMISKSKLCIDISGSESYFERLRILQLLLEKFQGLAEQFEDEQISNWNTPVDYTISLQHSDSEPV